MQKGFSLVLVLIVIVFLAAVGGGAYYLGTQKAIQKPSGENKTLDVKIVSPSPTAQPSGETEDWKTFKIKTLNLEFKLPSALGDLGELKEIVDPGDKGTKLCISFSRPQSFLVIEKVYAGGPCITEYPPNLQMGTTSTDYTAGREGTFTDLQGFAIQNGKYFERFVDNSFIEGFPQELISSANNKNGVEIIKIKPHLPLDEGPSLRNTLPEGWIGALLNTKNTTYPGLALEIKLSEKIDESLVDKILETFKFD